MKLPVSALDLERALRNFEAEPIHLPGSIQPHGVLLGLDPEDFDVTMASDNASDFLIISAREMVGQPVDRVLGARVRERLRGLAATADLLRPQRFLARVEQAGLNWDAEAAVHRRGSRLVLELENTDPGGLSATLQLADWIHQFPRNHAEADSIVPFCQSIADEVRSISGYDRIMVYRFHPDLHGEVIAESIRPDFVPYLGLHYPASYIPSQARALFFQNRVRVLVDVHARPAPIITSHAIAPAEPLDMTFCQLRSVSPVHLEYLSNMGVRATLVTSIIHGDRLWGLLVCHHDSPRKPSHALRAACNLLSEMISVEVANQEKRDQLRAQAAVSTFQKRILETFVDDPNWMDHLFESPDTNTSPIRAHGLAIVEGSAVRSLGRVPEDSTILSIRDWVMKHHPQPIYYTDGLGEAAPQFAGNSLACGILVAEIGKICPSHLIWFRSEFIHEVSWGGEPHKDLTEEDGEIRLHPRRSFDCWRSEILGKSSSWETIDLAAAAEIRTAVIEAVLRASILRGSMAEVELVRVQRAVQASSEAILIADQDGRPTFINQAFVQLCRSTIDDLPARSLSAPITNPILRKEILDTVLGQGKSWHGEVEVVRPGDHPTPVALKIDPVLNDSGEILGFIAMHFDLTERNQAQRLLEEHANRLETARAEIESQALLLTDAKARAESANRAKSDFLANMCHEIRTPMNGVIGISELLLDTKLDENQSGYVSTIMASGEALMTVINDILDLSKIEAGKMTIAPSDLDLRTMLAELNSLFEPKVRRTGIRLSIQVAEDLPRNLLGDSIRIRQILTNLIGNAIKFTNQGEVIIRCKTLNQSRLEARVRMEIEDTGIGIPSTMKSSIFDNFTQAESGSVRASAGTGLGLAICRRLADLMGGKVDFTSEEGRGSTFWLELTLKLKQTQEKTMMTTESAKPSHPSLDPAFRKLTILVAEDNPVNQIVARGLITRLGHEVRVVENGEEALEAIAEQDFDLILMDIQMPVMDGHTATAEIRRRETATGRRTPIVALTAYVLLEERKRCLDVGMDDYLSKPISSAALGELLARYTPETRSSI